MIVDETLPWSLLLKTACGAMRTISWRCVVPPKVFCIPLRYQNSQPFSECNVPTSIKSNERRFELIRLDNSSGFHVAHYAEIP